MQKFWCRARDHMSNGSILILKFPLSFTTQHHSVSPDAIIRRNSMSQIIIITSSHFLRPKVLMRIGFCVAADSSRGNDDDDVGNIWLVGWLDERARASIQSFSVIVTLLGVMGPENIVQIKQFWTSLVDKKLSQ